MKPTLIILLAAVVFVQERASRRIVGTAALKLG